MIVALLIIPQLLILAEVCVASPEPPAVEPPEWHWRMVDGRKCYFRADALLPREELFWEYDSQEFNEREGATVKGTRHYTTRELEEWARRRTQAAEERRQRWERRHRRHRDKDDDDDD
jgi:hypothetical protein